MDLAPLSAPTIPMGRASGYADRRRAAAERLSAAADLSVRLDAALDPPPEQERSTSPIDPQGVLRSAIRALLPLAYRTEGFEVTVSLGPDHAWAARLSMEPTGLMAQLVPGLGRQDRNALPGMTSMSGASGPHVVVGTSEAEIAGQLADLVWSGEVGTR
jgi:hypothetical protein